MEANKKKDGRGRKPLPSSRGEQPARGSSGPKAGKKPAIPQPDEDDASLLSPIDMSPGRLAAQKRGNLHLGNERMTTASLDRTPCPIDLTREPHKQTSQNQTSQNQNSQNQTSQNQFLLNQALLSQALQNQHPQNQHPQNQHPQNQHPQNQHPQNQHPQNQPLQNQLNANRFLMNQPFQNQNPQIQRPQLFPNIDIELGMASQALGHARHMMNSINELGHMTMLASHHRGIVERDLYCSTAQRIELETTLEREKKQHEVDRLELLELKYQNKALDSQIASEKEQKNSLRAEVEGFRANQLMEAAEKTRLQLENAKLRADLNDVRAKVGETEKKLAFHAEGSKKKHGEIPHAIEKRLEAPADSQSKTPPRKRARMDSAAVEVPVTHVWDTHLARLNSNMRKFDVVRDLSDEKSPTYQYIFLELAAILSTKRCTPKFESFLEYSKPGETYCLLQVLHEVEVGEQANPLTGESCNGHEDMGECLKVQCHKAGGDEEKKQYTFLPFDSNKLASN
ncbi:hypothetical protein CTA2_11876 [Colletotrichum tanaceti]|nr:hypothetical protein CTA2_11876 [Colletotrichum tanaceti]